MSWAAEKTEAQRSWRCGASPPPPIVVAVVLVVFTALVYANSFSVPLILDDWVTIQQNPEIRWVWPIWSMFTPAESTGVGGRPLANVSFVLNYAVSGPSLGGFHLVNFTIHALAGLALFGVVRRTLLLPRLRERYAFDPTWVAGAVAALWLLHPIQTQSVTYVSQRTESLMGMFYFFALYAFSRSGEEAGSGRWLVLSWLGCIAGVATKEGMVTAPLMIYLYEVAFVTGSAAEAWRRRRRFYVATLASWVLLACLMRGLGDRGVGFGHGMSPLSYLLIECGAIVRYAALALWPHPLVFDYGTELNSSVIGQILALVTLGVFGCWVLMRWRRSPASAYLGTWFLVTLAPTSSIVPIPLQPISENRIYVPIAAVCVVLVVVLIRYTGRHFVAVAAALALSLATLTVARNQDYRSEVSIWADTVQKRPGSSRAHNNHGFALRGAGRWEEAEAATREALRIKPDYADAHVNLASVLGQRGQVDEAVEQSRIATRLAPRNSNAFYNLGVGLTQKGDVEGAISAYQSALRVRPDLAEARGNLGILLLRMGRTAEAIAECDAALRGNPQLVDTRFNLAAALSSVGRQAEAVPHFLEVLRVRPNSLEACLALGLTWQQLGRWAEAANSFEAALRADPNSATAHFNLANSHANLGRAAEAIERYEFLLRHNLDSSEVLTNLAIVLGRQGRRAEAIERLRAALKISPDSTAARQALEQLQRDSNPPAPRP